MLIHVHLALIAEILAHDLLYFINDGLVWAVLHFFYDVDAALGLKSIRHLLFGIQLELVIEL